jgi:hypothetical protein
VVGNVEKSTPLAGAKLGYCFNKSVEVCLFSKRDRHPYWKVKPKQTSPASMPRFMDQADNVAARDSLRSGNGPTFVDALCGCSPPLCWLTTPICMEKGVKHHVRPWERYYNFVPIHKTLRTTPPMAAGVTSRLWEVDDIVGVLEAWEAKK